ncbi:chaperonin 10-like protein [Lipomyces kononenkoae]
MATQIALAITEIEKPLTRITLPVPVSADLQADELLIKLTAAGFAPLDQKLRDKNLFNIGSRLPAVIGGDLVGEVVGTGVNATFPVGTHVFSQVLFQNPRGGSLQEYTVINGVYAAEVPAGIADEEAALYPINAMTSAMALFTVQGLGIPFPGSPESANFDYASQKLAIIGGGSNTGKLAIQLARIAGIGTIVATASPSSAAELKSLGATHVISRTDTNIEEQVRDIVGDDLVYVYDTFNLGNHSLGVSLLSNSKKGNFVANVIGQADETVLAAKKGGVESKRIQGFSHGIPEFGQAFWKQLPIWIGNGTIKPMKYKVIDGLDAAKVNSALDEYRDGKGGARHHVRIA